MKAMIYIALVDEGTDVWRPVSADLVDENVYRIVGSPPDGTETWQFMPGDTVRCKHQAFAGGERRLVAYEKVPVTT